MGIGNLTVAPELLGDILPLLPAGCRITGSFAAGHLVGLRITAADIVDGESLRVEVEDKGLRRTVTVYREPVTPAAPWPEQGLAYPPARYTEMRGGLICKCPRSYTTADGRRWCCIEAKKREPR